MRLKREIQNISHIINELDTDIAPCNEVAEQYGMFCFTTLADANERILYTDLTGEFPIFSYNSNQ